MTFEASADLPFIDLHISIQGNYIRAAVLSTSADVQHASKLWQKDVIQACVSISKRFLLLGGKMAPS